MKKTSLMILSLAVILVYPALSFAGNDSLVNDLTSWAGGAVGMVKGYAGGVATSVKSYAGGTVGWATGNSALGNQVSRANWGQTMLNNPGGVGRTVQGTAVGAGARIGKSIGNTLGLDSRLELIGAQQNLPTPTGAAAAAAAAKPIDFIGATKNTSPSLAGQKTMRDVTNFSAYQKH